MTWSHRLVGTAAALALVLGGAGAASAQQAQSDTTQVTPLATDPLPPSGPGQATVGSAIGGSAPTPGAPSPVDDSQAQQGVTLKPGAGVDDMGAAAGVGQKPARSQ